MALDPSNSGNLEQLALKGLNSPSSDTEAFYMILVQRRHQEVSLGDYIPEGLGTEVPQRSSGARQSPSRPSGGTKSPSAGAVCGHC